MGNIEDLFKKIREGNEEDSREIFEDMMRGQLKGAAVAIISRNFSHSLGSEIKKQTERR